MKIGIISFAHMHAHSYASKIANMKDVILAGIADENEERGKEAAEKYRAHYYKNYQDLLNEDLDAVIVASENIHHHEHVIAAAKAEKHVLCEKPLATTVEYAQEMIAACRENGVILQTAFPVRFNTSIQRAKQMVEEGKLGRILAMRGTNRGTNPGGWFVEKEKSGGGAVMDHTVHVVDIMRWLTKAEISEVYCESGQLISDYEIDDAGILTFEFTNGVIATLDCSWSRNKTFPTWGDVTLEVVGTEGTLSIDAFGQNVHLYSDELGVKRQFWGDDMDEGLMNDFITSVKEQKAPSITGEDGLKAVEVALAAYESSRKKEPVRIG